MAKILDTIRKEIARGKKSRYAIAREIGISEGHLSRLMDGTKGLSIDTLERVADCLGLKITIEPKRKKKRRVKK
jgi:transcriptional regulator with XRE-family HTH domain